MRVNPYYNNDTMNLKQLTITHLKALNSTVHQQTGV